MFDYNYPNDYSNLVEIDSEGIREVIAYLLQ